MASKHSDDQVRVFLWALPRSVSTAMTKCMSFVDETQIWFEPYLYSYHNEKFRDPTQRMKIISDGFENLIEKMKPKLAITPRGKRIDNALFSFPWVKTQLESHGPDKKVIFIKDMAHVLNKRYEHLPNTSKFRHTFLIRDPHRMYPSFRKMMMPMIGGGRADGEVDIIKDSYLYDVVQIYKYTYDLWKYTKENLDPDAFVIDGTELAAHPEKLLPKYFDALGIPYRDEYLKWDGSPDIITEWKASFEYLVAAQLEGVIASATESTQFIAEADQPPSRGNMTPDVIKCIESALPYYNEMFEQRMKP